MSMKIVDATCAKGVPGAAKFGVVGKKLLYIAHYAPVPFNGGRPASLTVLSETLFDMRPPIAGFNK